MAKTSVVLGLFVFCLLSSGPFDPARPQSPGGAPPEPPVVNLDTSLVFTPAADQQTLTRCFERNTERSFSTFLSAKARRFCGVEPYELSRFQCVLEGADIGLTYGLIAGAAGMMGGAWDEPGAWYVAGAAAAIGALIGGTVKAEDPGFRVRLRWETDTPDSRGR